MNNNPGIFSLAGYTYQIRVFIDLLSTISENEQIGFEIIDDISLTKSNFSSIDANNSEAISTVVSNANSHKVVQVKKTQINTNCIDKIWYNWLIELKKYNNITDFILYYDAALNTDLKLNCKSARDLYNQINKSGEKKKQSLVAQNRIIYSTFDDFEKNYNYIKSRIRVVPINSIDNEITQHYKSILHWSLDHNEMYKLRIDAFCQIIQNNILNNSLNNMSYLCSFEERNQIINDIVRDINSEEFRVDYSIFKNQNTINLDNDDVLSSREYTQLKLCSLSSNTIKNLLMNQVYYEDYSYKMLCLLHSKTIANIENTANENFNEIKDYLIANSQDTPSNRLHNTIAKANSYAENEQIRKGACIHLTGKNIDSELQISWSDL